jgi:hypothetical protein
MKSIDFTRRHAVVLGLGAAVVGGLGCATAVVSSGSNTTSKVIEGAVVLTDDIVAFGRPDEALAKSMGKADAVAFLGTTNTYLLVEGGEALLSMAKLDPARLTLTPDNHRLFVKDKTIWGTLEFSYASDAATATEEERALFKTLRFYRSSPKAVTRIVNIKGAVYPAIKLQGASFTEMQKARKLSFRAPSTTETKPDVGKIAMLPAAIVVDVVTAPLQLLGAGVLLLSLGR